MADPTPGTSRNLKPRTARGVLPSLGAVIAEFALVCLLVALVPVTVYLDTTVLGDGVSEESLTEHLHNVLLAVAVAIFVLGAYRHVGMRGDLTLAATLFVLASACGSGGTGSTTSDQADGQSPDLVSMDPLKVLSESAESFQDEVQSLEADLEFSINAGGLDLGTSSQMTYQAPDQMHMTMTITGVGEFEILALGSEMYLNVPSVGWISFSLEDVGLEEVGLDAVALQKTFSDHSVLDYAALIQGVLPGYVQWLSANILIWLIASVVMVGAAGGVGFVLSQRK
ncbi:hypothetical protein LCGC14_2588350 [marine sediment metagenome]|uniref:Uncharacterized protein n=1 Tax=marine sediment metagenome TaxID=412755 RepID=A0A0F9ACD2_9ZZZZ